MSKPSITDEFWQSVINSLPDPVFVKDQEHRWIAFNEAFCSFMGYEREEILGRSDFEFFPRAEAEEFWAVDQRVFATEQEIENEELFTDSAGRTHIIATKKAVFRDPKGEKVLVGVIRDVTARRQAQDALEGLNRTLEEQVAQRTAEVEERAGRLADSEQALGNQRNLLEAILNSLGDGVLVVNPGGRLMLRNPAVERLIGRPPPAASFWSWFGERVSGAGRHLLRGAPSEEPLEIEEMMFSDEPAQRVGWLGMTARPLLHGDGESGGTVVVLRDVSARRQAEKELRESEQRLFESQKMEAVGRLAGGVAHDFNNLLLVIQGCAAVIDRQVEPGSSVRGELEQIGQAVERAASLTRQLLAFGRRQVVSPEILDLGAVVEGMEDMLRRVIGEHIELRFQVSSELPPVHVDRVQMEQVLMNLVINARDAMPSGGRLDVSVEKLGAATGPGQVALCVADSGLGMDEETRLRAFEPFFTTKPLGENTGLGLATVYGIVREAGGYVTVESRPGEGSSFRVFLPAATRRDPAVGPTASSEEIDPRGHESVLLVEDDNRIRDLLQRVLRENGYEVIACRDGKEALEAGRLHPRPIDLLLTDVIMPGFSGPEVAERMRSSNPDLRVLFMSGYSDDELSRYDEGRSVDFIQKPFCITSLMRELRGILDRPSR